MDELADPSKHQQQVNLYFHLFISRVTGSICVRVDVVHLFIYCKITIILLLNDCGAALLFVLIDGFEDSDSRLCLIESSLKPPV